MENVHGSQQPSGHIGAIWHRRKWIVIIVLVLTLIPALTLLWSLPQVYQATATLVVANPDNSGSGGSAGYGSSPPLGAVTERVLSRNNLEGIIKELNLFPRSQGHVSDQALADAMSLNVNVESKQTSNDSYGRPQTISFAVNYTGWTPKTAAAVANRLAKSYQATARDMQVSQALDAADALSSRMVVIRKKLDKQQDRINKFSDAHLGELPQQQQVNLAAIQRLDGQLQSNQTSQINAIQRRADLLTRMSGSGNTDISQLKQKLHDLRMQYTDQYPEVVNLKRQIAALESAPQKTDSAQSTDDGSATSLQGQLDSVNAQLTNLKHEETKLSTQIAKYQNQLEKSPLASQRLQALNLVNNQTSDVYSALLKQYEQARIAAATVGKNGPSYLILEPALAPRTAQGPKRLRFALMVLILCGAVALALVFIAEKRDTSFHTLEELREFTSVPILATVPFIHRQRDDFRRLVYTSAVVAMVACGVVILSSGAYVMGHGNHAITQKLSHRGS